MANTVRQKIPSVALLANALGDLGLKGIKVTGSNENVGAEQPATLAREYPQGAEIQNPQAFRIISIPGFKLNCMSLHKGGVYR
jgi:hypothetical protein